MEDYNDLAASLEDNRGSRMGLLLTDAAVLEGRIGRIRYAEPVNSCETWDNYQRFTEGASVTVSSDCRKTLGLDDEAIYVIGRLHGFCAIRSGLHG